MTETTARRHLLRKLRAARSGDERALRWLWETYAGPITGFLLARGTPEVEEVVNDVFVAAFGRLDTFHGDAGEFRAWLYAIARNKRIDHLRRTTRRPLTTPLEELDLYAVETAEDAALARVGDSDLIDVLSSLTSDQRDVIVLRFISDLSLEQTAEVVGKPVGAVKAIQHRALAQLRKKFRVAPYPTLFDPTI